MTTDERLEVSWDRFTEMYIFTVIVGGQSRDFELKPNTDFATYIAEGAIQIVTGSSCKYICWDGEHLLFHGKTYPAL